MCYFLCAISIKNVYVYYTFSLKCGTLNSKKSIFALKKAPHYLTSNIFNGKILKVNGFYLISY